MSSVTRILAAGILSILGVSGLNTDSVEHALQTDTAHRIMRKEGKEAAQQGKSEISLAYKEEDSAERRGTPAGFENPSFEQVTLVNAPPAVEEFSYLLPTRPNPCFDDCNSAGTATGGQPIKGWTAGNAGGTHGVKMMAVNSVFTMNGHEYQKLDECETCQGVYVGLTKQGDYIEQDMDGFVKSDGTDGSGAGCGSSTQTAKNNDCTYYKLSFFGASQPIMVTTTTTTHPPRIDEAFQQNGTLEVTLTGAHAIDLDKNLAACHTGAAPDYCEKLLEDWSAYSFIYFVDGTVASASGDATKGKVKVEVKNNSPARLWRTELPYPTVAVDRFSITKCDSRYFPTSACPNPPETDAFQNADGSRNTCKAEWNWEEC